LLHLPQAINTACAFGIGTSDTGAGATAGNQGQALVQSEPVVAKDQEAAG